ncbi:MAG: ADP-ribosylglycohydrolase family protein [Actinomycetales bacterium]
MTSELERARGALVGLAIGDALGMPTEGLPFETVRRRYGVLAGFEPSPPDNPTRSGRAAGRVTDDTDQAVIVGRLLVAGHGRLDPVDLAHELLAWEARMRAEGSLDLLGPSTRGALARLADGVPPEESGREGHTNGAAMRIAPVGICCAVGRETAGPSRLAELVDRVALVSRATHDTGLAISGASAVAAAVSAGVAGAGVEEAVRVAVEAARIGASYGAFVAGADVGTRAAWAVELVAGRRPADARETIATLVGTSVATQESVPAALALASLMVEDDPWPVVRAAASLGGDSDTIAAMAGAICGAVAGAGAFPEAVREGLAAANPGLGLAELADALVAVRHGR